MAVLTFELTRVFVRGQQAVPDYERFIESYKRQFNETGIKRLLGRDIHKFSRVMTTPEDLQVQAKVVLALIKDSQWRNIKPGIIECKSRSSLFYSRLSNST